MKVFIAGPRAISELNKSIEDRLLSICQKNITVIVGDANGVDKSIQSYYMGINYRNVIVFASDGKARNNIGNWPVEAVPVDKKLKGFDYYAQKDIAMAETADYGFMIWNGKSKGTLNNVVNLITSKKKVLFYFVPLNRFICIDNEDKLRQLISHCPQETQDLYSSMAKKKDSPSIQMSLFEY